LYDKDKVDIEHVSMEDVFVLLQCDEFGLTEEEAARRIGIFGPNKVGPWHTIGSVRLGNSAPRQLAPSRAPRTSDELGHIPSSCDPRR
jgi:hypothetical protein